MIYSGAIIVLLLVRLTSQDLCQQRDDVVQHSSYKVGEHRCCKAIRCDPGMEAVICSPSNPYSTTCRSCPENTYQPDFTYSVDMTACRVKQSCREGMKVEDDLSKVRDRKCICDVEKGQCSASKNRSHFCQLGTCTPGKQLNTDCSCSDCEHGFFKDSNGSAPCKRWTNCEGEGKTTVTEGTSVSDRECGSPKNTADDRHPGPVSDENKNSTKDLESMTTSGKENPTESTGTNDIDNTKWIAIGVVGLLVAVATVAIAVIILYIRCRWRSSKNSSSSPIDRVEEAGLNCSKDINSNCGISNKLIERTPHTGQNQQRAAAPEENALLPNTNSDTEDATNMETKPKSISSEIGAEKGTCENETLLYRRTPDSHYNHNTSEGFPNNNVLADDWKKRLNRCGPSIIEDLDISEWFLSVMMANESITRGHKEKIDCYRRYRISYRFRHG